MTPAVATLCVARPSIAGIDDRQRIAFVSLLSPLKVSSGLLRRSDDEIAEAAGSIATFEEEPPPTPEKVGALFSKTFGAMDAALLSHELSCRTRGLVDSELHTVVFVLKGGAQTTPDSSGAAASCIGSLRKIDLSCNYLTRASAQVRSRLDSRPLRCLIPAGHC